MHIRCPCTRDLICFNLKTLSAKIEYCLKPLNNISYETCDLIFTIYRFVLYLYISKIEIVLSFSLIRRTYCIMVLIHSANFSCWTLSTWRTPNILIHSIENEFIEILYLIFENLISGITSILNICLNWFLNECSYRVVWLYCLGKFTIPSIICIVYSM